MGMEFEKLKKIIISFRSTDQYLIVKQGRVRGDKNILRLALVVIAEQADCRDCHNEFHLNWMTHFSLVAWLRINIEPIN